MKEGDPSPHADCEGYTVAILVSARFGEPRPFCAGCGRHVYEETHRYDFDTDRCVCGGLVVYFENDSGQESGVGCEVSDHPFPH